VLEHPDDVARVRRISGTLPIEHRYTTGLAGERFYRALAERGVFLATRCGGCGVVYCPARAFCERCLAALNLDAAVEVGPQGVLESFTVVRLGLDGLPLAEPVVVGLIRLQGADTCLVHRLEAEPGVLRIGAAVQAVLKEPGQRAGGFADVLHFVAG
jgi:uncharacterized OB-fold protein